MSAIDVDEAIIALLDHQLRVVDDLDRAIGSMPGAVDGGIASAMIGFITTIAAEATGLMADSYRSLDAVARDVLEEFDAYDAEVANSLREFRDAMDES